MENILIIKTAAVGDVVRTTSLLNILEGNIYWLTSGDALPLLPPYKKNLTGLIATKDFQAVKQIRFSRVISLEEDEACAHLATELQPDKLTGIYINRNRIEYTDDSAHWFDMSRVSKYGLERANQLKAANDLSWQDHLFAMAGAVFSGEPYRINTGEGLQTKTNLIGIEKRSGRQWPNKQWWGYDALIEKLQKEGRQVKIFSQRENISEYMDDIASCSHIVSGDTLAMHLALALNKTCTAIFNCTSPQEIYDYGLLKKVVSPLLNKYFYKTSFNRELIESVSLEDVYATIPG